MYKSTFAILSAVVLVAATPQIVFPPIYDVREPFPVGDGKPKQEYFYKQLTDRSQCTDGSDADDDGVSCTVGENEATSFTVSWGASLSGAGWISADFSVSKSTTTGNSHTCSNEGKDGTKKNYICLWRRTGYTEYTVQDWKRPSTGDDDDWEKDGDEYQMWSPNSDQVGSDYVCAWDDDCWSKGDEWWGPSRESGGPAQYPFEDRWQ